MAEQVVNPIEPFGFRDGVSQPVMRGTLRESRQPDAMHVVAPGELVLGYPDNLGMVAPTPRSRGRDFGRNGTYLVVRELAQDTAGLEADLLRCAHALAGDARVPPLDVPGLVEWLGAKMVGRWKDGSSLVRNPDEKATKRDPKAQPDNRFLFGKEDPDGLRCPFGAHIRRANPRESFEPGSSMQLDITNRHRILRVGRRFDPVAMATEEGAEKGLLFMCINADIERQFEFLQQSWLMGPDFHELSGESDPLLGSDGRGMTIPTPNGPLRIPGLGSYVTSRGGGYFFMPSRSALRHLAGRAPRSASPAEQMAGVDSAP